MPNTRRFAMIKRSNWTPDSNGFTDTGDEVVRLTIRAGNRNDITLGIATPNARKKTIQETKLVFFFLSFFICKVILSELREYRGIDK